MAKRANGEGSIFKRKDGTWSAELSYRDDYGTLKLLPTGLRRGEALALHWSDIDPTSGS